MPGPRWWAGEGASDLGGADHADFTAPCLPDEAKAAPALCADAAGFDRAAFRVGFDSAGYNFSSEGSETAMMFPGRRTLEKAGNACARQARLSTSL